MILHGQQHEIHTYVHIKKKTLKAVTPKDDAMLICTPANINGTYYNVSFFIAVSFFAYTVLYYRELRFFVHKLLKGRNI